MLASNLNLVITCKLLKNKLVIPITVKKKKKINEYNFFVYCIYYNIPSDDIHI